MTLRRERGIVGVQIDAPLTETERGQLAGVTGCDVEDPDNRLSAFATAAVEEYASMFLGQRVFTRGSDMREYRLFPLIKGPFGGVIPHEQPVSDLPNHDERKPVAGSISDVEAPVRTAG